jgi:peptidylprolyl isomerase
MADAGKPQPEGLDKAKMKQYLVPALAVAAVIVLAGLVISVSGGAGRKMSDGSNGSADDPGLKEATPGVKYRDIKEGVGDPCPPGASVTIHYTGWQENGDVFDSTREGAKATGQPATFQLGGLIKGWQEGIPGMKPGGIRKLVISPEKGYGTQGGSPLAGKTLIFEVELIESKPVRDTSKLADGTAPGADDPGLKPLGTGGLKYRDLKEGNGAPVQPGAKVTIHYIGWLTNGTVFDSSHKRGKPATFELGGLIKGWQEGIPGMKPGGIRKLVIPPELGYGPQDKENIPPNSTLIFEVELIE